MRPPFVERRRVELHRDLVDVDVSEAGLAGELTETQFVGERERTGHPRRVKLIAHNSVIVKQRIGPVLRVIRAASSVDDDSAALWALIQSDFHANQRVLVDAIAKRKGLKVGVSVDRAADILWMLNHPDTWLALHYERGWSAREFEKWLAATAAQQLLKE